MPSRTRACGGTSRSPSGTSRRGCAASGPWRSTTSWRTPRRPRSRARRCGSGCTTAVVTAEGTRIDTDRVRAVLLAVLSDLPRQPGDRYDDAADLFRQVALAEDFPTFLTVPAYTQFLVTRG